MTAALTVAHAIAAPLEVIPAKLGADAVRWTAEAKALAITDDTFDRANSLLIAMHGAGKEIEAKRVELKGPVTKLGKAIDQVASGVADPLDLERRSLQSRVRAYQEKKEREAAAARAKVEEEARLAREAAEKERQRLQAIADEEHRQREAEAKRKADADAAELAAVLGTIVEPEPVKVEPAPVVQIAAPALPAAPLPVTPKASAIQVRKVKKVNFTDRMLVPVHVGTFVLRPIDEAQVKAALLAGAIVSGAELIEVEELGQARVRA